MRVSKCEDSSTFFQHKIPFICIMFLFWCLGGGQFISYAIIFVIVRLPLLLIFFSFALDSAWTNDFLLFRSLLVLFVLFARIFVDLSMEFRFFLLLRSFIFYSILFSRLRAHVFFSTVLCVFIILHFKFIRLFIILENRTIYKAQSTVHTQAIKSAGCDMRVRTHFKVFRQCFFLLLL